jgi:hypothetical protein
MTSALLEALYQTIHGNSGIHAAVDGQIFKNKALEESGAELKKTHKTIISCEISKLDGSRNSTEPTFIVDVRSKQSYEYCSEVVLLLKELLDDGFSYSGISVNVLSIEAPILVSQELVGWRSHMKVHGIINSLPTIVSLTTFPYSPQVPTREIKVICEASDAESDKLLYRFWVSGPGTGNKYIDLTGWQPKNWTIWIPKFTDSGVNTLKVQIIDQKHADRGGYDAETSLAFTVSP